MLKVLGAASEGMWSSLSEMYITEETDFSGELLGKGTFPIALEGSPALGLHCNISWPACHESTLSLLGIPESTLYPPGIDADSSSDTSNYYNYQNQNNFVSWVSSFGHEGYHLDKPISPFFATTSCNNNSSKSGDESLKEATTSQERDNLGSCLSYTKRSRSIEDLHQIQILERNVKPKTVRRLDFSSTSNDELGREIAGVNGSRSSPSDTKEDSNGETTCSKENVVVNINGKTRSSRDGTTTNSQSLYARKRRDRINQRLRMLQNIIPSGTKVDISTMLEEAVHYVKFLQLQIRLLSSDEMWMYAPIAYNGMNTNIQQWTTL